MAKSLQPKTKPRNTHPLLDHRLAAANNGWTQNPCTGKSKPPFGWNTMPCDEAAILTHPEWRKAKWAGTAVRIVGDLCVVDSDITLPEVADHAMAALEDLDPDAYASAIIRDSGATTLALFYRCVTPFKQLKTHSYTARPELLPQLAEAYAMPETSEALHRAKLARLRELLTAIAPQKVEIYGPQARGRYFQYEGPHSDGRNYHCWEQAPWNVSVAELPPLPLDAGPLIDLFDDILRKHLTLIPEPPDDGAEVVYDLTPETMFYPKNGDMGTLEVLTQGLERGAENGIYGCLAATAAGSRSQSNCKLYVSTTGRVIIVDWSHDGRRHYMVTDQPPPAEELPDDVRAILAGLHATEEGDTARVAPRRASRHGDIERSMFPEQTHNNARDWLLTNVANFSQSFKGRGGVVSIHTGGEWQTPISMAALREAMAKYGYTVIGVRGGQHFVNPANSWLAHAERIDVAGIRMRPELPRPMFTEGSLLLVNRYQPPVHPTKGGSTEGNRIFMERFVPDEAERRWVMNWTRCLIQHPEWRMVGLAMLAREMGSGRGLWAETLQYLLGEQFVAGIPYGKLAGGDGSRFNAEVVDKLLIYVNEAPRTEDHKYHSKHAAREALKDFIEPNHRVPFRVEQKGVDAYFTRAAVSTALFTNNIGGVPIGEGDRRMAIVINGPQMTVEEREAYQAWLLVPDNIGALYRHLRDTAIETDKGIFDPYMAPQFHGRDLMIEASKSALDMAWDKAIEKLATATELYAMSQVVAVTKQFVSRHAHSDFDELIEKHTVTNGYRIGIKNGTNWLIRYGDADDNRQRVYAFDEKGRKKWSHRVTAEIKAQLDMAQKVVDEPARSFSRHLSIVKNETAGE